MDGGQSLRSNRATVDYVRAIAAAEGLDLDARLGTASMVQSVSAACDNVSVAFNASMRAVSSVRRKPRLR